MEWKEILIYKTTLSLWNIKYLNKNIQMKDTYSMDLCADIGNRKCCFSSQ